MHGQQTSSLVHRETSIRACLYMKMGYPGVFFVEIVVIARNCWAGTAQSMMLFTSADKLHTHPSVCGLTGQTKPLFKLNPPTGGEPLRVGNRPGKKPKQRALTRCLDPQKVSTEPREGAPCQFACVEKPNRTVLCVHFFDQYHSLQLVQKWTT